MAQQGMRVDMKDVHKVRMTCDQLTVSNLALEMDMYKPSEGSSGPAAPGPTTDSKPLVAKDHANDGKFHLLLAASGSVATIKLPNIVQGVAKSHKNISMRIIITEAAINFLQGQSEEQPSLQQLAQLPNVDAIYRDADEWKQPWTRGAPILHIELRRWAHLLVVAPLSANTLGKISNGLCDNLLTSVIRAWEVVPTNNVEDSESDADGVPNEEQQYQRRIIVAPAMNTAMWRHPVTSTQLQQLHPKGKYHWFDVMRPVEKTLACGDTGDGAMCDWTKIVFAIGAHIDLWRLRPLSKGFNGLLS